MEKKNDIIEPTPMLSIWKVILVSMVITVVGGFIWHFITLGELRLTNQNERIKVSREVEKLTAYRAQLLAASSTQKELSQ